MNLEVRQKAHEQGLSLMEYILKINGNLAHQTGTKRTILAACPNSKAVIKAALRSAKRANAPIKFATTLNQVDRDGGYTGLTPHQFVKIVRQEARSINLQSPIIIAIDHGGPWLKDKHRKEELSLEKAMEEVKLSFETAIDAGYDLIHVDPTIDINLKQGEIIKIADVAERTVELIKHCEDYRKSRGLRKIAYEVGTEEVHGGLVDLDVFNQFFELLKIGLAQAGISDTWPCFVVGKVGTDLHTTEFDPNVAATIVEIAKTHGSVIKGHYSDNVTNPQDYPISGMGGANVGPEYTEREYESLIELVEIEEELFAENKIAKVSNLKKLLWQAVINSNRWQKWLSDTENANDFYANSPIRQEWLIKTGCRYIWEKPEVEVARNLLYANLAHNDIMAEEIVLSKIEKAMDKYYYNFNLIDLNENLLAEQPA
ncbi:MULTISPECIES: class II D-tagatose-bisphosphate aldolase non-catalytic subunit [Flavobacteriaceae]|uniref:class II D-tagatose-bisphosphate aldolase non-catalytic subunit n=1 Tax=Flavobacteriaceae TaxID=49546 RepID=UPI0014929466|nr:MULTISPECIES: class II D-tagatose-bisphosphate aldolase, non-catalytic subunit [Allomuricauda]MDC6366803.1 class II D-tagatose-bisphosphate aldolase, non-catalytic subunit [Muricauda sp. AC10]